MSSKDDGGLAFPVASDAIGHYGGMSLRDWFAGQAIQAILCDSEAKQSIRAHCDIKSRSFGGEVALQAYDLADAMLAERSK